MYLSHRNKRQFNRPLWNRFCGTCWCRWHYGLGGRRQHAEDGRQRRGGLQLEHAGRLWRALELQFHRCRRRRQRADRRSRLRRRSSRHDVSVSARRSAWWLQVPTPPIRLVVNWLYNRWSLSLKDRSRHLSHLISSRLIISVTFSWFWQWNNFENRLIFYKSYGIQKNWAKFLDHPESELQHSKWQIASVTVMVVYGDPR